MTSFELTPLQMKHLGNFLEPYTGSQVYKQWVNDDRGQGKTQLLRAIALLESRNYPVIVFVANNTMAREFIKGMPEDILRNHQFRSSSLALDYRRGIKLIPISTCRLENTYGLSRECILIDDVQSMSNEMLDFHMIRAKKMFVCGQRRWL